MITLGTFIIGLLLAGVGFLMVWQNRRWYQNVGSLNIILGYPRSEWLNWSTLGVLLMVAGFLLAIGLLQAFLALTVGRFFRVVGLR